jgi:hypothetical protein
VPDGEVTAAVDVGDGPAVAVAAAGVDVGPPGRPSLIQPGVDADNFLDRSLARIGTKTGREPHPQGVAEVLRQGGFPTRQPLP